MFKRIILPSMYVEIDGRVPNAAALGRLEVITGSRMEKCFSAIDLNRHSAQTVA
jgi:hypothetical protein